MTTDMSRVEQRCKKWVPSRGGGPRWYVNDWQEIIGMKVYYYNTGNVSEVDMPDEDGIMRQCMSNCHWKKYVQDTKVWFGEDGALHVDHCRDDHIEGLILRKVGGAFALPEEAPEEAPVRVPEAEAEGVSS